MNLENFILENFTRACRKVCKERQSSKIKSQKVFLRLIRENFNPRNFLAIRYTDGSNYEVLMTSLLVTKLLLLCVLAILFPAGG